MERACAGCGVPGAVTAAGCCQGNPRCWASRVMSCGCAGLARWSCRRSPWFPVWVAKAETSPVNLWAGSSGEQLPSAGPSGRDQGPGRVRIAPSWRHFLAARPMPSPHPRVTGGLSAELVLCLRALPSSARSCLSHEVADGSTSRENPPQQGGQTCPWEGLHSAGHSQLHLTL